MSHQINYWFDITYRDRKDDKFKTCHHLAKDKERAERWGNDKFGKVYSVQKTSLDDLKRDREEENNRMISRQVPLGMKITKNVYESDINLTEMLFGKPKKDTHSLKLEQKKTKWDLVTEND
jgi:hypothetical protein